MVHGSRLSASDQISAGAVAACEVAEGRPVQAYISSIFGRLNGIDRILTNIDERLNGPSEPTKTAGDTTVRGWLAELEAAADYAEAIERHAAALASKF